MNRADAARLLRSLAAPLVLLLAGCGGAGISANLPVHQSPTASLHAPAMAGSAVAPSPSSAPPTPLTPPPSADAPPATAAPAAPSALTPSASMAMHLTAPMPAPQTSASSFAIRPVVGGGSSGSVTVMRSAAGVRYHVVITGLTPGSSHAVHDHQGSCSNANRSTHLSVLTIAAGNPAGTIVFDTSVSTFEAGPGRIVIVYSSPSPTLITGCADLG